MPTSLETRLEKLKAERRPLAAQFDINPQRLHLAVTIKDIDDQIAECTLAIRSAPRRAQIPKVVSNLGNKAFRAKDEE